MIRRGEIETNPATAWPELSVVQRWFHSVITNPSGVEAGAISADAEALAPISRGDLESMITRSENLTASERIAIYANAYYARLIECMGDSFPVLKRALGHQAFNGFVFGYLQEYPSRSYTLAHLGTRFVDYLLATKPQTTVDGHQAGDSPADWSDFFVDLAELEWTIAEVFDGPGVETDAASDPGHFLRLPADTMSDLPLQMAPCLRLLAARYPVNDFYTELRSARDDSSIRPPLPENSYVAISRQDYVVRRYNLSRCQYELLKDLQAGMSLGAAVGRAAEFSVDSEDQFASELRRWFENWTRNRFFSLAF